MRSLAELAERRLWPEADVRLVEPTSWWKSMAGFATEFLRLCKMLATFIRKMLPDIGKQFSVDLAFWPRSEHNDYEDESGYKAESACQSEGGSQAQGDRKGQGPCETQSVGKACCHRKIEGRR